MKNFFKSVLATVVGLIIFGCITSILSIITLVGIALSSDATPVVSDNSVLVINLSGTIQERSEDNPFAGILGNSVASVEGLDKILAAIKKAKESDKVKGIYIESKTLAGASPAMLEEIHDALADFKKSKKFIVSYGDTYTQGAYYVCSTADSIVMNPQGMLMWMGMSSQVTYYKDLFDKLGVKMNVFKVGTYKSAVEPYFLNEMSEANREQITVFQKEIWGQMLKDISASRKISVEKLNEYADSAYTFKSQADFKRTKMIDKLAFSDDVPNIIANMIGVDSPDDYNTISVSELASVANDEPKNDSGNIIAVYYADGAIVQEPTQSAFGGETEIVGEKVIKDLEKLADDEDVKAVVLRVNSPGGSAYASEQIWHQVMNIKSKKPIIVSMGGYAASGGYYISCAADWIVAEPTTLTGSIGIFGTFPQADELLNQKLGVHFSTVKTNEFADFGDISRAMTPAEEALMQGYINRGYELFTKRCADGRRMKQDSIKAIAEGRVWTGVHAKQIGLVDQLGNLDDAIEVAKKKAKVEDCTVMSYPAQKSFFDNVMDGVKGNSYANAQMRETFGEFYDMFSVFTRIPNKPSAQAALPYYIKFNL